MDCAINGAGLTGVLQVDMRADGRLGRIARQKVGGRACTFPKCGAHATPRKASGPGAVRAFSIRGVRPL